MNATSLPNLFLIGGMRCGSTSLYLMLGQHPEVFLSPVKEPQFFLAEALRMEAASNPDLKRVVEKVEGEGKYRTFESYRTLFSGVSNERWIGEASHYLYHSGAIRPILTNSRDARVIVVFRDPTERIFSEYLNRIRGGFFSGSFEEFALKGAEFDNQQRIVGLPTDSRLPKGLQAQLIQPWVDAFGPDRLRCLFFDDLEAHPLSVVKDIFAWLEVDRNFSPQLLHSQKGGIPRSQSLIKLLNSQSPLFRHIKRRVPRLLKERYRSKLYQRTLDRPEIAPDTREKLREFYSADVMQLEILTGRDLSAWRFSQ